MMRRLAVLLCLMLVAFAALTPRATLAAQGMAMASAHAGMAMTAHPDRPCADCPAGETSGGALGCSNMGAACGIGADCNTSLVPLTHMLTGQEAMLRPALQRPAPSQTLAQRALVPEPPPPRI